MDRVVIWKFSNKNRVRSLILIFSNKTVEPTAPSFAIRLFIGSLFILFLSVILFALPFRHFILKLCHQASCSLTNSLDEEIQETILRKELRPVEIYMGEPTKPNLPDWVAISHAVAMDRESCNLLFYKFERRIVGINHSEWDQCEIEITNDDGSISWDERKY